MRIQLIYSTQDIRRYDWDFIPCVGDIIWDEHSTEVSDQVRRVAERNVTLDRYGEINKISLLLERISADENRRKV